MVTEESLKEKYATLPDIDLIDIVTRKDDYTELAIAVARRELKQRQVHEQDIAEYQTIVDSDVNESEVKNGLVDLELWRKLVLYFVWMPKLRTYFTDGLMAEGYILRSNQASYYSILGAAFFLVSFVLLFSSMFLVIWAIGFLLSYLFDIGYNRERLKQRIRKILASKQRPFGYY